MFESLYHVDVQARAKLKDDQIRPWAKADHVLDSDNKSNVTRS